MTTTADIQPLIDQQVNIALARLNFWEFCLFYDEEFFTKRQFLKQIADGFQTVYDEYTEGRAIKVSASMPPRAGKSFITSLFCAWWLGKLPEHSVMRNTCTDRLYTKFSYDVRNIVRSDKFRQVFPKAILSKDKTNVDGWNLETAKQVSYFGAGVGGTIIGFGANLAVSDDLYKDMIAALSENVQEGTAMWKQSAHNSRMEKNCPEIFIGTRWTKRDEIGKAIEEGKIDIQITIPALTEDGQSFCEDVKSTAEYLKIKEETDEEIFEAEYQQNPIEIKGLLFPPSQLKYFSPDKLRGLQAEFKYMPVDPADTTDNTSAPTCELYGTGIYVTGVLFNNHGTDITIPDLIERIIAQKLNKVEIEGISAWRLFGAEVRNKVQERYEDCEIRIIKAVAGSKDVRIQQWSAFIKNHFYFLEEQYWTPEYRKFMKELTSYLREGKSKKDDAPDSLSIGAKFFQANFSYLW
jgi:predicted phage terminase large subunit-like protein